MSQPAPAEPYDPYVEKPSFLRRHIDAVWAVGVAALTIVLTVISFPPFRTPEFAYAFAAPAIFWAYLRPGFKLYAITILAAQAVAWTILLAWLHHVTWLGLFLLGPFIGVWIGLWYLAVGWAVPRLMHRPTSVRIVAMFGLAALWVLLEWTRTWVLTGFPWLPLAASQWQRATLLQIASYTGAAGVSFILICFNFGFAAYAHRLSRGKEKGLRRRSPEFMTALLVLMFPSFLLLRETMGQKRFEVARIGLVQPYIPQSVKWDESKAAAIMETLEQTTLRAAATGDPDLLLWPEAVTPYAVKGDPQMQRWTEQLVKRAGVPLLLGSIGIENTGTPGGTWTNSAFFVDTEGGLAPDGYAKRHLVPFGEYVPLRPVLGWLNKVVPVGESDFQAGDDAGPLLVKTDGGLIAFGPLICYEDIFPQLARSSVLAGADVLAVLTNNAWYGEGAAAYQHAAHSVLRAVETRRPVVRSGNGGWSGWIDEYGNIRAELKRLPGGAITTNPKLDPADPDSRDATIYFRGTATVPISRDARWVGRNSYYVEHGEWFSMLCGVIAAFGYAALSLGKPPVKPVAEDEEST